LLVDDGTARVVAERRGLKVIGTVGVPIAAERRQLLPRVAPVLDRMIESGMFVSATLRERVLVAVDEAE
jgi:predicted nucleic acid-binding protein